MYWALYIQKLIRSGLEQLSSAARIWSEANASVYGAAIAYYTLFGIAPLLFLALATAGAIYGKEAATNEMREEFAGQTSPQIADALQSLLAAASAHGIPAATVIGSVLLFIGSSGLFRQLQQALDAIWGLKRPRHLSVLKIIRSRLWVLLTTFCVAALLIASLAALAVISAAITCLRLNTGGLIIIRWIVSLLMSISLFGTVFKVLPNKSIPWGVVWRGALVTAVLFNLGNFAIGAYMRLAALSSSYGAIGSLVIVTMWAYYSAQIILFGAALTRAFAERRWREPANFAPKRLAPQRKEVRAVEDY